MQREYKLETKDFEYHYPGGFFTLQKMWALPPELTGEGEHFVMTAAGDGMRGAGINNGDHLVFKEQETAEDGDIVLVAKEGSPMVRRYTKQAGKFVIRREDGETPDEDAKDYIVIGKLMTIIRKMFKEQAA